MGLFNAIDEEVSNSLDFFVAKPIELLAGGIGTITIGFVLVWAYYKVMLILTGVEQDPVMPFLRETFIKIIFLLIASSSVYIKDLVVEPLQETTKSFASDIVAKVSNGNGVNPEPNSILSSIEAMHTSVTTMLDGRGNQSSPLSEEEETKLQEIRNQEISKCNNSISFGFNYKEECIRVAIQTVEKERAEIYKAKNPEQEGGFDIFHPFASILDALWLVIKKAIIFFGLGVFELFAFLTVFTNKVLFSVSLGVAPIFIFFGAFERTKGWFQSWLNASLGYWFVYPIVLITTAGLLGIMEKLYKQYEAISFTGTVTLSLTTAVEMCALFIIFGFLMTKIASLATSLFSGGVAGGDANVSRLLLFIGNKNVKKPKNNNNAGIENAGQGSAK